MKIGIEELRRRVSAAIQSDKRFATKKGDDQWRYYARDLIQGADAASWFVIIDDSQEQSLLKLAFTIGDNDEVTLAKGDPQKTEMLYARDPVSRPLIGRAVPIQASDKVPKSICVIPIGLQTVDSFTHDGGTAKRKVNVTRLSAVRMEAARQQLIARGEPPFFDYCHRGLFAHDDRKSGIPTRFWFDPKRGVMADSSWSTPAEKSLVGSVPEFDAFSPHAPLDDEGEVIGLYQNCGGLVNRGALGRGVRFSETADLQTLVAADPNIVAQVDAALREDETNAAKEKQTRMKELIAKLCARWKIKAEGKTDDVLQNELIAALAQQDANDGVLIAWGDAAKPLIIGLGLSPEAAAPKTELIAAMKKHSNCVVVVSDKDEITFSPIDQIVGKELVGFAVDCGIIAPAERADWEEKISKDRKTRVPELVAKTPTVLIGRVVQEQATKTKTEPTSFEKANALIAADPELKALAVTDPKRALSKALEKVTTS